MKKVDNMQITDAASLTADGYPTLHLQVTCDKLAKYANLAIGVEKKTIAELKNFAQSYFCPWQHGRHAGYLVDVDFLTGTLMHPCVFLFGVEEVWYVSPGLRASQVVKLNRRDTDDRSFYHLFVHEYDDFFILRYESGMCRITYDGKLIWHIKLYWDDLFDREEEHAFVFSNEHTDNGKEWRINLVDGKIMK